MLDELLVGGEMQETSKRSVLKTIMQQDLLQEETEASRAALDELMM
jgi:AP-1 complex subunit sigma 1/2